MLKQGRKPTRSTEDIFKYYLLALEFVKHNVGYSQFSRENNINKKDFTNICARLLSYSIRSPDIYNELCKIAIDLKLSNSSVYKYCQQKGLNKPKVREFMTHINFIKIIQDECVKKEMEYIECATIATNPHLLRIRKDSIASIDELYIPHVKDEGKESNVPIGFRHVKPNVTITFPHEFSSHALDTQTNEIEFLVEGIKFNIPRNISDEKLLKLIKTMREL